jgi:hypothetical protein
VAASPDPLDWVRELGLEEPWEYARFEAFARVYLNAGKKRWVEAEHILPGIGQEVELLLRLRSGSRRN